MLVRKAPGSVGDGGGAWELAGGMAPGYGSRAALGFFVAMEKAVRKVDRNSERAQRQASVLRSLWFGPRGAMVLLEARHQPPVDATEAAGAAPHTPFAEDMALGAGHSGPA